MVDLSGGPDGLIEHGFSNTVFIIPGVIIFGLSVRTTMNSDHESLLNPSLDEMSEEPFMKLEEPDELPTDRIKRILEGGEINTLLDREDLEEVLLRRSHDEKGGSYLYIFPYIIFLIFIAFFGWKLYQSIKNKEKKREEKKKLKQKKKK